MDDEYGTNFDATAVRGLQDGTLDGYLRQLRRLARLERMRPGDGARGVLEARLMQIVQGDLSESAAKLVLAAAKLAEKMAWLAPVVRKSDWYLVMSSTSGGAKNSGRRRRSGRNWRTCAGCVRLPPASQNGRRWRWRAYRWDTACGAPRRGVGQERKMKGCVSLERSPGGGSRDRKWGPGCEHGCNSWQNSERSKDSTPTGGRCTSPGRRWGKRWPACRRGGRERRLSGGIASAGWGQRNSGKWGHRSQQLCCGGGGSQRKSRRCIPRPLPGGSLPAREKSHGLCAGGGGGGRAGLLHEAGLYALFLAVMDTPGDRLRGRGSFPTCWGIA